MGPFTFKPGDVQEIELAYVVANGLNGPVSSVNKLMEYIDSLRYRVSLGEIIVPNDRFGMEENKSSEGQIRIFPNPANNRINIKLEDFINPGCEYIINDIFGRIATNGKLVSASSTLDISFLKSGFYVISVISDKSLYSGKFIKY